MGYFVVKKPWNKRRYFLAFREVNFYRFWWIKKKVVNETYIKKAKFLAIRGSKGTGKTRELKKLSSWSNKIFGCDGVYISGAESMTEIFKKMLTAEEMKGLSQNEKIELCIQKAKNLAIFFDDIDRITGHLKRDFIKGLVINCKSGAVAFEDEKFINQSLLFEIRRKQGLNRVQSLNVVELSGRGNNEEIKDIGVLVGVFLVVVVALLFGMPEFILGAMGLRYLTNEAKKR